MEGIEISELTLDNIGAWFDVILCAGAASALAVFLVADTVAAMFGVNRQ